MTRKLTKGLVALMVLISGLGVIAAPGAAATYDDGDESIVVQVDWDDAEVDDGDTAELEIDGETVEVTVRDSGTTTDSTHWFAYDELDADPDDEDTVDVELSDADYGEIELHESVSYVGVEHLEVSENEGVEAMIEVDEEYDDLPVDVDLTVYDEDETTVFNSTTVEDVDAENTTYHDFHPDIPENETVDVTVQIEHVHDDTDSTAFESVDDYQAELITVGIFGIGGDDSTMLIVGVVIIGAAALMMRD